MTIQKVTRSYKGKKYPTYWYPRLKLTMTDQDVVEKFHRIVGCGSTGFQRPAASRPNDKMAYTWECCGRSNFTRLVALFWPHLGQRRRARIVEVCGLTDTPLPASCRSTGCG